MASQVGQDLWVLSLIKKGIFLDIGCRGPEELNNTFLLEQNGWDGVSIDIVDYSKEWKERKTTFICADALTFDYRMNLTKFPFLIDYLSLDIEGDGDRFKALLKVISDGYEFKVITIEHDSYRVNEELEKIPQRALLKSLGYVLAFPDVKDDGNEYEDWWINPKYICLT
jgi:hypothetical protein